MRYGVVIKDITDGLKHEFNVSSLNNFKSGDFVTIEGVKIGYRSWNKESQKWMGFEINESTCTMPQEWVAKISVEEYNRLNKTQKPESYIMLEGKKIELSEESVESLKEGLK